MSQLMHHSFKNIHLILRIRLNSKSNEIDVKNALDLKADRTTVNYSINLKHDKAKVEASL